MTALDDAIEATGRTVEAEVTIGWPTDGTLGYMVLGVAVLGGGTNPIFDCLTDVQIDRAIADLPESVTQVAGTASAQATVTLRSGELSENLARAFDLSPFSTSAYSSRTVANYGIGAVIIIASKILVSGSFTSTTLFTGTIIAISMSDDGAVTLTCQDKAAAVQSTVNLPAAGGPVPDYSGFDFRINPMAVIDLALRSAGLCITPPTRATAVLSVPGVGAGLPEVGELISAFADGTIYSASPWGSTGPLDTYVGGTYRATTLTPSVGAEWMAVEGWFKGSWADPQSMVVIGDEADPTATVYVELLGTGAVRVTIGATSGTTTAGLYPNDGAYHYVCAAWKADSTATTCTIRVDSTTSSTFTLTAGAAMGTATEVWTFVPCLGLQVWRDSAAAITAAYNDAWVPTVSVDLPTIPHRLTGVQRASLPAWQTIQQVAAAYGDVAYFDGAGVFTYETRATWKARRFGTPERALTGDRIMSGVPSWSADGMRTSVRASTVTPVTATSTTTAPAWSATEVYEVPANSTAVFDIALDYSLYDLEAVQNAFQSSATSSWVRAVPSTAVGDPAAVHIAPIGAAKFTPIAGGLRLTVRNNNAAAISLWTPGDGGSIPAGPYAVAHGKTVTNPEPVVTTVQTGASITTGGDLDLGDNPWRQSATHTLEYLADIAPELHSPQVMWPSIEIPLDPRLNIGDVITVQDTRHMDVSMAVQIVGISWDMPAEGMHTMTLTVRTAYAVTGWVFGIAGRTELDTTTVLV